MREKRHNHSPERKGKAVVAAVRRERMLGDLLLAAQLDPDLTSVASKVR